MLHGSYESSIPMPNGEPHLCLNNQPSVHQTSYGSRPFAVDPQAAGSHITHTQYPYVTGSSVIGVKFKDGVLLACDTLGAYGSTLRYKNMNKILRVNDKVIIAASGEISDLDFIGRLLHDFTMEDYCHDDDIELGPKEVYSLLCRILYNRRTKFDPLWNSVIVAGLQDGEPFVGHVDMIGVHYSEDHVVTGLGSHLATPILREQHSADMSEEEATALVHKVLKNCFYRDTQTLNKFRIGTVTKDGVKIGEPFALSVTWDYAAFQRPTSFAPGVW